MKYWLFKVSDSIDELDIEGVLVLTDDSYQKWKSTLQEFENEFHELVRNNIDFCIKDMISRENLPLPLNYKFPLMQSIIKNPNPDTWNTHYWQAVYDYEFNNNRYFCIGSSEYVEVKSIKNFLNKITITEISENFANELMKYNINNTGFASRYYDFIFHLINEMKELGIDFLQQPYEDMLPY